MICIIEARLEEDQLMQKEVDFTCYIVDVDGTRKSSLNFNKMITRELYSENKAFRVPSNFVQEYDYVLQCEASYYNLGSRTDKFYDTFTATPRGSLLSLGGVITDGKVSFEDIVQTVKDNPGKTLLVVLFLVVIIYVISSKKKKEVANQGNLKYIPKNRNPYKGE